jgi:hypothetical protein
LVFYLAHARAILAHKNQQQTKVMVNSYSNQTGNDGLSKVNTHVSFLNMPAVATSTLGHEVRFDVNYYGKRSVCVCYVSLCSFSLEQQLQSNQHGCSPNGFGIVIVFLETHATRHDIDIDIKEIRQTGMLYVIAHDRTHGPTGGGIFDPQMQISRFADLATFGGFQPRRR